LEAAFLGFMGGIPKLQAHDGIAASILEVCVEGGLIWPNSGARKSFDFERFQDFKT